MPGSPEYDAILIPDSAIVTDQSHKIVHDGRPPTAPSCRRRSGPGRSEDGLRIVRGGLTGDDRIIINGAAARPAGRQGDAAARQDRDRGTRRRAGRAEG